MSTWRILRTGGVIGLGCSRRGRRTLSRGAKPRDMACCARDAEEESLVAKAYLMVRAVVVEAADRPGFDRWYEAEHLPDAVARFGAERGWRCWSRTDPAVHYAFYEFADADRARSVLDSPELRALVAEFD